MKIGYARVSTEDQNPDLQFAALKKAGCERIYTDKATGANVKRPELTKCLKALNEGDTPFAVWKLDRLGRSLHDLINLLDELNPWRCFFQSVTEAIDTTTPTGRAMWQMFGILAELDRSLFRNRQKQEERGASRGVKMGRKLKLTPATSRIHQKADRTRRTSRHCRYSAQCLAANAYYLNSRFSK